MGVAPPLDTPSIDIALEALLFVADGPQAAEDLAVVLGCTPAEAEEGLGRLQRSLEVRGLRLSQAGGRWQMVTAPEAAAAIERFVGQDSGSHLTAAALEALAIVAYRQPVTRAQVEAIRGVNSDGVLRTLQNKGLIATVGRLEQVGRPEVLATTIDFLNYFGIETLDALPTLPELEEPAD